MKQKIRLLILFTLIVCLRCVSQHTYEPGYFLEDNDIRTECLILNEQWKNNPVNFSYKLSENSEIKTASIKTINEFGIPGDFKYIRLRINIDRSPEKLEDIETNNELDFNQEVLFLKVLVEGKANLYVYADDLINKFFYKVDNSLVEQLVFKKYLFTTDPYKEKESYTHLAHNNHFKQQLLKYVSCGKTSIEDLKNVDYKENPLTNYFVKYNECENVNYINYNKNEGDFNITIRPGISFTSISFINNNQAFKEFKFKSNLLYRIGVEFEYAFPFENNTWSAFIEPTYTSEYSEKATVTKYLTSDRESQEGAEISYQSFDVPVGLRYSHFLRNKRKASKVFFNFAYVQSFTNKKSYVLFEESQDFNSSATMSISSIAFGAGFKSKNLSLEARYQYVPDVIDETNVIGRVNSFSIILGYSIL